MNRKKSVGVLLVTVGLAVIGLVSAASAYTLDIQAYIDGRDQLIIQGDTLQWHHYDFQVPSSPAYITTPPLAQVSWSFGWADYPYSSQFTGLNPALPAMAQTIDFEAIQARESASMVQQPTAGNGYTAIVEFNDNGNGGAAWYEVQLTYNSVPIPGTLALLGPGLLGLAVFGRRRIFKR